MSMPYAQWNLLRKRMAVYAYAIDCGLSHVSGSSERFMDLAARRQAAADATPNSPLWQEWAQREHNMEVALLALERLGLRLIPETLSEPGGSDPIASLELEARRQHDSWNRHGTEEAKLTLVPRLLRAADALKAIVEEG